MNKTLMVLALFALVFAGFYAVIEMQMAGNLPQLIADFYADYGDETIGGARVRDAFTFYHFTFIAMWMVLSFLFVRAMPHLHKSKFRMVSYGFALFILGIFLEDVIAMPLTQRDAFTDPASIWHPFGYFQLGDIYLPMLYPVALVLIAILLKIPDI